MPCAAKMPASRSPIAMPARVGCSSAGDAHQARHALRDLIEAGPLGVGAVGAEAGDVAVDQARIARAQRVGAEPELRHHRRAEVLDDDVGLRRHPPEHVAPGAARGRSSVTLRLLRLTDRKK